MLASRRRRLARLTLALAGAVLAPRGAGAADSTLPVHAPAGTGQQALSVFISGGDVVASACAAPPCIAAPVSLGMPASLRGKGVRAEVVSVGAGRRAVVVTAAAAGQTFQAVVSGPLAPGAPQVSFAGLVGLLNGEEGTRSGPLVQVSEPAADGARRVLVGEQHEAVSLCGRPTILAPQLLNPADLQLHPAKVQRLGVAERDSARAVNATRIPDDEESRAARSVLGALAASSALGPPQALTDGDAETVWSENVGGDGKGEFVTLHAPPELPLSGLELTIRPKLKELPDGAAPERFFIAGPREVVAVTLPEDAWKFPGARYRVVLDPPLQSSCLALVLDTAYTRSKTAQVTIAELSVLSELSSSQLPELVASLAGGGQRAEASKSLLVAGGTPAFAAVARAFPSLDEGGKRVALWVMDQAPCEQSAPVYVAALIGKIEAQVRHAQNRLRRCGAVAGAALSEALASADKTDKRVLPLLVSQLTITDPARAVEAYLPLMDEKTVLRRRLLRTALAQAARSAAAEKPVRAALASPSTAPVALLDLLRALGNEAPRFEPEAGQALQRLSRSSRDFRTRYLLLGPTASLSPRDPAAESAFRGTLSRDPDPRVRAAALSLVRAPRRFQGELLHALGDGDVRVREAAIAALGTSEASFAGGALTTLLAKDPWPLVRAAAADALSKHPASPKLDEPLEDALGDDSALVRARSLRALAERRVTSAADRIRDRLEDADEWPEVRAEAARALGVLCDAEATDMLTAFAKKLAEPMASPDAQMIGVASVQALGRLAPADLARRLAPLTDKKAPPQARRATATALSARTTCRAR